MSVSVSVSGLIFLADVRGSARVGCAISWTGSSGLGKKVTEAINKLGGNQGASQPATSPLRDPCYTSLAVSALGLKVMLHGVVNQPAFTYLP